MSWRLPEQISSRFTEHHIPTSKKDETVHVWHFVSEQPSKGTVVHFHGNAQNMSAHVGFVAWLLKEGYDLVTFDYRGYGKSGGQVSRENTVEDGAVVLEWVKQAQIKKPLYVVAQSLGGAVAVVALQKAKPSMVSAVVLESTFFSYRALARDKLASFFLTWPFQWPLSYLVTDSLSPRDYTADYPYPTLLIHGSRDPVVPLRQGLVLADLLDAQNKTPVSFRTELGRGHTSCFTEIALSPCKQAVLDFFTSAAARNKHNAAGEQQ